VRQFLHTRMAALSETAQQIVSTAAVIGRSFDLETVIAASGRSEEESVGALEELLARRLILEGGATSLAASSGFDFAHAQLRRLVYDETSQVRRRLLHRRVADALAVNARRSGAESASVAAALANHYQLGGATDKAAHWAAVAGEQARQVYANREAIAHFERALELGAVAFGDAIPYVIHIHLGDLHTLQGEYAQALEHYLTAKKACQIGDKNFDAGFGKHSGKEGEVEHRLGRLHLRLGDRGEAVQHFARALDLLPGEVSTQRALVLADWSLAAYMARDLEQTVRLAQDALQEAQAALARVHDILSLVERKQNNLPAALEHAERSLQAAARLHDPAAELAALNSLALTYAALDEPDEAIPLLHAALERCVRLGDRHQEAALHNNLADLYHATGQHEAAMEELKRAVAIFAEIGAEAGPENAAIWMLSEW
jgi:tetratricopeptide (TPR) repeat protein